jgi:hypothetical protein
MNKTTSEILTSTLISIARHFISIVAAYLISKGLVAPDILSEGNIAILASGLAFALISLGAIVYKKLKTLRLLKAAQQADAGERMSVIKATASSMPLLGK